jgi:hypothetical protein
MISRRFHVVLLSFWPGLPQIWSGQILSGLLASVVFAVLFNFCIVTQFLYTEMMDVLVRQVLTFFTLAIYFLMLAWGVIWVWKFHPERFQEEIQKLFLVSSECYLQGRWAETRDHLESLIALDAADTQALLRLTRVLEITGETALARRTLDQCRESPGAHDWQWEIDQMARRLSESCVNHSHHNA